MTTSGTSWCHIIINARGTWLHGDPRGFRNRDHRIHSDGDYKKPPPKGQHAQLHAHQRQRADPPVTFPVKLWPTIGQIIRTKAQLQDHRLLAMNVDKHHVHLLAKLPDACGQVNRIVGTWKQATSHAMRDSLPGRLWAQGLHVVKIRDRRHQLTVFDYIVKHRTQGAWVWTFRDEVDE